MSFAIAETAATFNDLITSPVDAIVLATRGLEMSRIEVGNAREIAGGR